MLFHSSLGYALFRAHKVYDFERSYIAIEEYVSRFAEVFELIAYHPFGSDDEAQMYRNAACNDTLPEHLIEFLVKHLPEPIKGNEHSYSLSLPTSSMSHPIVVSTNIACSRGVFHDEIMRGVRMHIDTFFEDMKAKAYVTGQREVPAEEER
ncbi:uncharacterized protein LOC141661518 isoform X2 [Apium graveolens]|uniref:uncharacterized protein LOC141661518 isoform X2 n=1 Tax=Apium graveolens TaxID=4045 RepID=UPI003D7915F1